MAGESTTSWTTASLESAIRTLRDVEGVNVKADGNVVVNRRTLSAAELTDLLKSLVQLNSEQAVIIRGDEAGAYKNIINVLNICTEAGISNVAFATAK